MSSWARSWAYEQRVGKEVDGKWRKNAGAKSVLAAVCEFPDQDGRCYVGQKTLAQMCDMSERTVREHLHFLEHDMKLIRREERRRPDGTRTSDYIWVLAPPERLKPPEQPAKSAASVPTTGRLRRNNRQITSQQPAKSAGPLLNEPLEEPLEEPVVGATPTETPTPDDTTTTCLKILLSVKGFPRDQGENALKLAEYRDEFPNADPVEVCRDFKAYSEEHSRKKPTRLRLRNFFKQATKPRANGSANGYRDRRAPPKKPAPPEPMSDEEFNRAMGLT